MPTANHPLPNVVDPVDGESTVDSLDRPTWVEGRSGFPTGSWGEDHAGRPDAGLVLTIAGDAPFTGGQAGDLVAFTEFLAGTALDDGERNWLIERSATEFESDPAQAMTEMKTISFAVQVIPELDPLERADSRHKALAYSYRLDAHRERLGLDPNPVLTLVRAHNPAVLIDPSGVIITADALAARRQINRLLLSLADRRMEDLPHLRFDPAEGIERAPIPLKAEVAGSWIRLVLLRAWLEDLPPVELARLRARLAEVIDSTTDFDLVAVMLSFRVMLEAVTAEDDDDHDDSW